MVSAFCLRGGWKGQGGSRLLCIRRKQQAVSSKGSCSSSPSPAGEPSLLRPLEPLGGTVGAAHTPCGWDQLLQLTGSQGRKGGIACVSTPLPALEGLVG